MNVKKIFLTLVTIVGCVIIGALVLNVLLPNVTTTLINATEDMLYKATGMSFDFNNDETKGGAHTGAYDGSKGDNNTNGTTGAGVTGYK